MAIPLVWDHWNEFLSGQPFPVRYGVLDMLDFYSFDLKRVTNHQDASENTVVIRMRASNIFVRTAIDPLFLVFSKEDKSLRRLIGRSLVIRKDGEKVIPINAELVIEKRELRKYYKSSSDKDNEVT
jgi:hypothetical protein